MMNDDTAGEKPVRCPISNVSPSVPPSVISDTECMLYMPKDKIILPATTRRHDDIFISEKKLFILFSMFTISVRGAFFLVFLVIIPILISEIHNITDLVFYQHCDCTQTKYST